MKLLVFLILLLVYISLCTQQTQDIKQQAVFSCLKICKDTTLSLENGPCLSDNNPEWNISDWVCDVAHSPRQSIDDLPENQCLEFRERKASHFVEVDTECNLITVY
jgi:hypothetical protein